MLMRAQFVVEKSKLTQQTVQCCATVDFNQIERRFERAEEAFNTAVLSRAAKVSTLMAHPSQAQAPAKYTACKHPLVVGAQRLGRAISAKGDEQVTQQREAAFVGQPGQIQQSAATVIDEAENVLGVAGQVLLARHVHRPDTIARLILRHAMFEVSSQGLDLMAVLAHKARHEGLADACPASGMQPVKGMRDTSASGLRHQSLEPDRLAPHPGRFGLRAKPSRRGFDLPGLMACASARAPRSQPLSEVRPKPAPESTQITQANRRQNPRSPSHIHHAPVRSSCQRQQMLRA